MMNDIWTCIIRIKTNEGFRSHLIEKSSFTIGRTQEADLPILAPSVSRLHLVVSVQPGSVHICDQNSANGTFVNEQQVDPGQEVEIFPGDVVRLGTTVAEFQFMSVPRPFELLDIEHQHSTLLRSMDDIAREIQGKAREEAEKETRQARLEAEQMVSHARRDAEIMLTQGSLEIQERRQAMEAEFARMRQEVQSENTHERLKARREADLIIAEAQKRIHRDYEESSLRMEAQLKDVQNRTTEMLSHAEQKAQSLLDEARGEANRLRSAANEEMRSLHQKAIEIVASAETKAQSILAEAREEAAEMRGSVSDEIRELQQNSGQIIAKAEAKAEQMLVQAREEASRLRMTATEEARSVQQDSLKKVSEMTREAHDRLQREISEKKAELLAQARIDVEKERSLFDKEHEVHREMLRTQIRATEEQIALAKADHERFLIEKGRAQVEYDKVQGDLTRALKLLSEVEELEKRRAQAEREYIKFSQSREEGVARVEAELKALREKGLVEYETKKAEQDNELAKARLKSLEDAQKRIEAEEQKYEQTRKLRAIEAGQRLAEVLLPELGSLPSDIDQARAKFKQSIDMAVAEVLMKGASSIQMVSEAASAAPVKTQEERDKRNWKVAATVAVALVAFFAVFGKETLAFFEGLQQESYASKMIEKRRIESIYTPEQTENFRMTYTDNVLYMKGYFETKTDPLYIEKWTLKLNDIAFLRSLTPALSEEEVVQFIAKETNLVQRLGSLRSSIDAVYLNEGIGRLREAEEEDMKGIVAALKGEANYKKIREIEQKFLKEYQSK